MPTPKTVIPSLVGEFAEGQRIGRGIAANHPTWGLGHWTRYLDATQQAITLNAGRVGRIMFTERLRGIAHVIDSEVLPDARRLAAMG